MRTGFHTKDTKDNTKDTKDNMIPFGHDEDSMRTGGWVGYFYCQISLRRYANGVARNAATGEMVFKLRGRQGCFGANSEPTRTSAGALIRLSRVPLRGV